MFNLGISEIAVVALLALLLIGPKELPEVARVLGRFLNDIKRSANGLKEDIQKQVKLDQDFLNQQIKNTLKPKSEEKKSESTSEGQKS